MQAALAAIWKKNLSQTRDRMNLLQRASEELSTTRTMDEALRADAVSTAHKMAGSLGMFGLHNATEAARAIEHTLDQEGLPQPERLREQVGALAAILAQHLSD